MKTRFLVIVCLLLPVALHGQVVAPATPGVIYATSDDPDALPGGNIFATLLSIDPGTGAATVVANTSVHAITAIAMNSTGDIYCSDTSYLYRLDAVTGDATLIGNIQEPNAAYLCKGFAFDDNDVLHCITRVGAMLTIDTNTAAAVLVAESGVTNMWGLTKDPYADMMYASNFRFDSIYTYNLQWRQFAFLGYTDLRLPVLDIAIDAHGFMYGMQMNADDGDKCELILINRDTAEGTLIGSTGRTYLSGLAILPDLVNAAPAIAIRPANLQRNYPNPFNPSTTIPFNVPSPGRVELSIYNATGERVRTLLDKYSVPGQQRVHFDGRSSSGAELPSGVYLVRLRIITPTDSIVESQKITLVR